MSTVTAPPVCRDAEPVDEPIDIYDPDAPLMIPVDATTFDGFMDWITSETVPKRFRITFLHGELHIEGTSSSMEEIFAHVLLKTRISYALTSIAVTLRTGMALGDGVRFANRDAGVSAEPDAMFCTFAAIEAGRVRFVEQRPGSGRFMSVQGSPDLLVEIISDSSVRKDMVQLRADYFTAGVREYWILDARQQPLVFHLLTRDDAATDWSEAAPAADGARRSPVLDRRVSIVRGTDPIGGIEWNVTLAE